MKKIICLLGSPRQGGNSETICDRILDVAAGRGAETRKVALNELSFKGCQACLSCKKDSEKCVVEDDLAQVLDAIRDADVLIAASPVYFGHVSGQLKSAVDRMYSFLKPDYMTNPKPSRLAPGKKCVFVFTQGSPDGKAFDIEAGFERFFQWFGYQTHVIKGIGLGPEAEAAKRPDLMAKAEEVAAHILE